MRLIKPKAVQIHWHCICGCNVVDTNEILVKWADLVANGIKRRKDKKTGKPFLSMDIATEECHCNEE